MDMKANGTSELSPEAGPKAGRILAMAGILSMALQFPVAAAAEAENRQAEWPSWRGPHANGSTEKGSYPTELSEKTREWKISLSGTGGSTPVTYGDQILVTVPADGKDTVMSIGFDGKEQWSTSLGNSKPNKHRQLGSSSNSSPVTDGKSVFVFFKSGNFAALNLKGDILWNQNLEEKFGPEVLYWDQGSSPILTKNHVIMARIHDGDSWIAAFNKSDGELVWKTPRNYAVPPENDNGYTTPILYKESDGVESILLYGSDHLTSYTSKDGELRWSAGGFNPRGRGYWPSISSPVIAGKIAVVPVGRDDRRGQAHMFGIKLGGSGDVSKSHKVWQRDDIGVFVPALAEYKGLVYLLRNKGGIACLNPETGKTVWENQLPEGRDSYYSSPAIANGHLYAARNDGSVFVANIEGGYKFVDSIDLGEKVVASPVPVKNRILIRGYQSLSSFK